MIKLVNRENPDILAFMIKTQMEQEDVDWLVERIDQKYSRTKTAVSLYVKFEDFEELTLSTYWEYFKMLLEYVIDLIKSVKKVAVVTANAALRKNLNIEFMLIPTVSCKTFDIEEDHESLEWLEK
ncbi:SpoIIAA family protein [Nonlabens agnitus]|uniref:STAS/SEC14 domain-containing protein n=1 Tax=Nonlabens agnitus TaxID=870484 RepID=A0A2S9WT76_9FLAO|nr:STAS/SEC14 domain-containing protein [Nonlabens agnitus]PRP66684.1 hypothetical protein BST86_06000 [Nonlabens agnitus]